MNVIIPPHPTQTPYSKSNTTTRAVFHPLAKTCHLAFLAVFGQDSTRLKKSVKLWTQIATSGGSLQNSLLRGLVLKRSLVAIRNGSDAEGCRNQHNRKQISCRSAADQIDQTDKKWVARHGWALLLHGSHGCFFCRPCQDLCQDPCQSTFSLRPLGRLKSDTTWSRVVESTETCSNIHQLVLDEAMHM